MFGLMFGPTFAAVTCLLLSFRGYVIAIDAETVILPLDHFGDGSGTFENRFWVSEEHYRPGGPVFLFDRGSDRADKAVKSKLQRASSVSGRMMKEFNAIGILWEHRFFGESTPYNITSKTPSEELRYLTAEQALADIPRFAGNFSRPNFPNVDLRPNSTPWIFVGSSYSGARAAWVRNIYPETIFAAYASSATVETRIDNSAYAEAVYRALNALGYGNCTRDVVAAISYIDEALGDPERSAPLKQTFLGERFRNKSNAAFGRSLSQIVPGDFQSFGVRAGYRSRGLRSFCDWMSTDPDTNETSGAEGWAKTRGAEYSTGRWSTWPYTSSSICERCDLDDPYTDPDYISFMWLSCTEFGEFNVANLGPNQIVSKYRSIEAFLTTCHNQFPDGRSSGLLPDVPRASEVNARLGGWTIRPSNVYWSIGQWDPWRPLSVFSQEDFSPNYTVTQSIPDCGESTAEDTVFGYVGPDGLHNFDITSWRDEFPQGAISRQHFYSAMEKWLPCFRPGSPTTADDTGSGASSAPSSAPTSSAVTFAKAPSASVGMALLMALGFIFLLLSFDRV